MIRVGDIRTSRKDGKYLILALDKHTTQIRFLSTGYETSVARTNIYKGNIKDKLKPSVSAVGFLGCGNYTSNSCEEHKLLYHQWKKFLRRHVKQGTVDTIKYYHNFQNFAKHKEDEKRMKLAASICAALRKKYEPQLVLVSPKAAKGYYMKNDVYRNEHFLSDPSFIGIYTQDVPLNILYEDIPYA